MVEALASWAGATSRIGTIADGTTLCDFTPEEREKKHSLAGAVVHLKTKGGEVNLIDTPGYPDFLADAVTSLGAAGTAVLTVAARVEGIPFHAKRLWELAGKAGCARAVVLTRLDGDNLDLEEVISGLRKNLGDHVLPLYIANGTGAAFTEVSRISDDSPYRSAMVDAIVEGDDALMESYLESGEVSDEDLAKALPQAIVKGTFAPLFCVDPIRNVGVKEFGEFFTTSFPVSSDLFAVVKGENAEGGGAGDRVVARAWKVLTDKHLGQISYLRVLQGTLTGDTVLTGQEGKTMKVNGLSTILGKDLEPIDSAGPGSIVAVSRMEDIHVGDELVSEGEVQL
ncbi:MAG: GTP-binding protein, partial [Planctomycetota bacterium]